MLDDTWGRGDEVHEMALDGSAGTRRMRLHHSGFEAAVEEAEANLLAAREAWHAERGDPPPTRTRITGLPKDAPEAVRAAELRYLQVLRTAERRYLQVRDRWLVEESRRSRR